MGRNTVLDVPYYDVWRDEIMNVSDTTSYSYFHELRHQQQNRIKFIRFFMLEYPIFLTIISWVLIICAIISFFVDSQPLVIFCLQNFMLFHAIFLSVKAFLEIDATIYGLIHAKLFQKNRV